jgi:hypothetical protein
MRKHKTNVKAGIKAQFGNDGLKIVPVGTEPMQPDHASIGRMHASFYYQRIISHDRSRKQQWPAL